MERKKSSTEIFQRGLEHAAAVKRTDPHVDLFRAFEELEDRVRSLEDERPARRRWFPFCLRRSR